MDNKTIAEFIIDPGNRFSEYICVYPEYNGLITYNIAISLIIIFNRFGMLEKDNARLIDIMAGISLFIFNFTILAINLLPA